VALDVHKAAVSGDSNRLGELLFELTLFLNPKEPMDAEIIDLVRKLQSSQAGQAPPAEFGARVALLFKHDWDLAQREAQPFRKRFGRLPKRTSYEKFECAERSRKKLLIATL
jgi:hypothetical protein